MRRAWLSLLALAACYGPETFDEDYDLAFCEKVFECEDADALPYLPYESSEDCVAFRATQREEQGGTADNEECEYDANLGKQCVEDMTSLPCPSYNSASFPSSCVQV